MPNQGKAQEGQTKSFWTQLLVPLLAGLVGIIVGAGSTFFTLQGRISRLEGILEESRSHGNVVEPGKPSPQAVSGDPNDLISIIKDQQRSHVKESSGELDWQAFTDADLHRFVQAKTPETIVESLKHDPKFLDVVLAIRQMEPGKRTELLLKAEKPLHPTWKELGRITPAGQTEAGQNAERIIASAIVDLVKQLDQMPDQEYLKLYNK